MTENLAHWSPRSSLQPVTGWSARHQNHTDRSARSHTSEFPLGERSKVSPENWVEMNLPESQISKFGVQSNRLQTMRQDSRGKRGPLPLPLESVILKWAHKVRSARGEKCNRSQAQCKRARVRYARPHKRPPTRPSAAKWQSMNQHHATISRICRKPQKHDNEN